MSMNFEDIFSGMDYESLMAIVGVLAIVGLIALIVGIVTYVLTAMGVYTIAKRRGINNAWLAWIPVASNWILGSISDQYQYVAKGKVRYNRIILLALAGASMVFGSLLSGFGQVMNATDMGAALGSILGGSFFSSIVSLALTVFQFIALYDLYTSCNPQNGVLFLVLSIIFAITQPFFIFSCRNKDLGMPPKKPVYQPQEPLQIPQEPSNPWEQNNNNF